MAPRYEEYVGNIRDSGAHLLAVINDILDVSRIEAGRMELYPEHVAPEELIDAALRLVRDRAHEQGIRLSHKTSKNLPNIVVDRQRMKQVLLNLLSNAVKFTLEDGKVEIKASKTRAGAIVMSVTDTGIGMSADEIEVAMVPFGQVDSKLARSFEGTGLGLPLTNSFVALHDGKMTITSEPGVGTTVSVLIPASRVG